MINLAKYYPNKGMTLPEYYQSLSPLSPRAEFVKVLLERTGKNRNTITKWLNGSLVPGSKMDRELIEELTGVKFDNNDKQ